MISPPIISIIIPVYNAEPYVTECIESVIAQTFTDWELILVDDGSTDHSGIICDNYAARDPRVRVIHQPNGGVSAARNTGLNSAKGDWVTFVDADDTIEPGFFHIITQTNNTDLIITSLFVNWRNEPAFSDREYIGKEQIREFVLSKGFYEFRTPWMKFFKKSIIDNQHLRFPTDLSYGEDTVFINSFLLFCNSITTSSSIFYNYRQVETSLSHNTDVILNNYAIFLSKLAEIYDKLGKRLGIKVKHPMHMISYILTTELVTKVNRQPVSTKEKYRIIHTFVNNKHIYEYLKTKKFVGVRGKIIFTIMTFFRNIPQMPFLYSQFLKLFKPTPF